MRVHFVDIEYRRVQYKLRVMFNEDAEPDDYLFLYRIVPGTTGYLPAGYASFIMNEDSVLLTNISEDFPIDKEKLLEDIIGHVVRLSRPV